MKKIKVRIAPSPTGDLHIGTARTALFNYLFAKKNKGEYLIRIENTDKKRSSKKYEDNILANLKWLGLGSKEKIIHQLNRLDIYKKYAQKLLQQGKAYYCFCTEEDLKEERQRQISQKQPPRYLGNCRKLSKNQVDKLLRQGKKPSIRLKVPDNRGIIKFKDNIRGEIKENASLIGDFIIIKSDSVPVFFFAGVVDDYEQSISHVIRGEDHISNTFNQILIYEALGWDKSMPEFAHLPLILNADRSKMSKRKGDTTTVSGFFKKGYLPESLINFMALLGWHPRKPGKKGEEIYSINELIPLFEIKDIGKSAAIFDISKLDYLNSYYIKNKKIDELKKLISPEFIALDWKCSDKILERAIILVKDRMKNLAEFTYLADYFFKEPVYDDKLLIFKKSDKIYTQRGLRAAVTNLKKLSHENWEDQEKLLNVLSSVVKEEKLNNGDVFWSVRVGLSGREASPSPVELLWALGKKQSLKRLNRALELLK